jgi:hypothetical protein
MYLMNTKSPVVGPGGRPVRWNSLHADEAEFLIRTWAVDSGKVFVSRHAYDRQMERSAVTRVDVMDILRTGYVCEEPEKTDEGWIAIIQKALNGGRNVGAVTAIIMEDRSLDVITVQWMDRQ